MRNTINKNSKVNFYHKTYNIDLIFYSMIYSKKKYLNVKLNKYISNLRKAIKI